jgi:hypothetical protein
MSLFGQAETSDHAPFPGRVSQADRAKPVRKPASLAKRIKRSAPALETAAIVAWTISPLVLATWSALG